MSSEAWVYMKTEPSLWTVGWFADNKWHSESDHDSPEKAAARVHYLHGGSQAKLLAALRTADTRIVQLCDMVCHLSGNPRKVRAEDFAEEIRVAITEATS
jgi:hypothetical protein